MMRRRRSATSSSDVLRLIDQVESLMNKLGIEQRVQYGAEKMLDVSFVEYAVYAVDADSVTGH